MDETEASGQEQIHQRLEQLERELAELRAAREEEELEALRRAAESDAAAAPDESESVDQRTFVAGSRSMQMLNPEISLSADLVGQLITNPDMKFYAGETDRSAIPFLRALDLHMQSSLDPFSFTKLAIGFGPEGAAVEELFITWTGLLPRTRLTLGRFRQLFGVLNRWHMHDMDQVDRPLAMRVLLGEEGLAQDGVSLAWLLPAFAPITNELTIEITNGGNQELYAGEFFSVPVVLGHLKNYLDLSENTYLELGLSGQWGFNNRRGFFSPSSPVNLLNEPWRSTALAGIDLTLVWEPLQQARYRSLTWRSEGFWLSRETGDSTAPFLHGWGAYSYLQYQVAEPWYVGVRADCVQPPGQLDNTLLWQVSPYVTFWQSEFVYLRLQANHGELTPGVRDTRVMLQVNWAAGPHKHEKY